MEAGDSKIWVGHWGPFQLKRPFNLVFFRLIEKYLHSFCLQKRYSKDFLKQVSFFKAHYFDCCADLSPLNYHTVIWPGENRPGPGHVLKIFQIQACDFWGIFCSL
jgi:hypothetical protein